LRQATSVTKTGTGATTRLSLRIPNYFDGAGIPRDPVIDRITGTVSYQSSTGGKTVPVDYYIQGRAMYRDLNGKATIISGDVQDFNLFILDSATTATADRDFNFSNISGKVAEVKLQIRFKTSFRRLSPSSGANASTAIYNTTLLRNVRTDALTGLY
jgi:hypothetical protein